MGGLTVKVTKAKVLYGALVTVLVGGNVLGGICYKQQSDTIQTLKKQLTIKLEEDNKREELFKSWSEGCAGGKNIFYSKSDNKVHSCGLAPNGKDTSIYPKMKAGAYQKLNIEGFPIPKDTPEEAEKHNGYIYRGKGEIKYTVGVGEVKYCPLDKIERPVCAYTKITTPDGRGIMDYENDTPYPDKVTGWDKVDNTWVVSIASPNVPGLEPLVSRLWTKWTLIPTTVGGDSKDRRNVIPAIANFKWGNPSNPERRDVDLYRGHGGQGYIFHQLAGNTAHMMSDIANGWVYISAEPKYVGNEIVPVSVVYNIVDYTGTKSWKYEVINTLSPYVEKIWDKGAFECKSVRNCSFKNMRIPKLDASMDD